MALDSNSPGEERGAATGMDRAGAAGLKLVGERGETGTASESKAAPGAAPIPARKGDRKSRRQLPLWLFVALFVVFLIAFGYQTHQAGQLETEVTRLETSLAQAQARLESHRTHLLEIRGGVHDLSARLESLRGLIDRDPTVETGQSSTAAEPTGPARP